MKMGYELSNSTMIYDDRSNNAALPTITSEGIIP